MMHEDSRPIRVWGIGSGRCMRVHWVAQELGLDYEVMPVLSRSGETATDSFTELNPKQKIPVLQHGSVTLSESAAIITYLSEVFPSPSIFYVPPDPVNRGMMNQWCFFICMELDAHTLYLIRRQEGLKDIYGEAPTAVSSAEQYFSWQMGAVVKRLETVDQYLFGDKISVADILLSSCIGWAVHYHIQVPEDVHEYQARITDRPAYQAAFEVNYPNGLPVDGRSGSKAIS